MQNMQITRKAQTLRTQHCAAARISVRQELIFSTPLPHQHQPNNKTPTKDAADGDNNNSNNNDNNEKDDKNNNNIVHPTITKA